MNYSIEDDPWLGALEHFPTILHARASFSYEVNTTSLQRAIVSTLRTLGKAERSIEISLSDHKGYLDGRVTFRIGVGNGEAFDTLDSKEEDRVLRRIEERGPFSTLDIAVHAHYSVEDGRRHAVREDRYLARMLFRSGRIDILVHHLKGIRRIQPDELVRLLVSGINLELSREGYPELESEDLRPHSFVK